MPDIRIFMSFDSDHDVDLYNRIAEQSLNASSGFEISDRSDSSTLTEIWEERVRRQIRNADEVIVICGEHTDASPRVSTELRIAREEQKPYFLLWGRRERMCTRPTGANATDSMYSWTREILQYQIGLTLRNAQPREIPDNCKRNPSANRSA